MRNDSKLGIGITLGILVPLVAFSANLGLPQPVQEHPIDESEDKSINDVFKKIQQDRQKLRAFFEEMPKGGNIHHHLSGAVFAEDIFEIGVSKNLCVNLKTKEILEPNENTFECGKNYALLSTINKNDHEYQDVINSWSIKGFDPTITDSPTYFFNVFKKISNVTKDPLPLLIKIKRNASEENVSYIETMLRVEEVNAQLGKFYEKKNWDDKKFKDSPNQYLEELYQELLTIRIDGLTFQDLINNAENTINELENNSRIELKCDQNPVNDGCEISVHYLYHINRTEPSLKTVFALLTLGFEVADQSYQVVGINLVGPEHKGISLINYKTHMKMIDFLHAKYEDVNIVLHAGELRQNLVPDHDLRFHIHDAIVTGHVQRIGHGVSVTFEDNQQQLLRNMNRNKIAVEVPPTSNEFILGVSGANHPFPLYLSNDVPVVIASDDPGILDTDLTEQFVIISTNYPNDVDYNIIKKLIRNSLEFSFMPDGSLWQNKGDYTLKVIECRNDDPSQKSSNQCNQYISNNEKARLQWELEREIYQFEASFDNP